MKTKNSMRRSDRTNVITEAIEPRRLLSTYTVNTLSDAVTPVTGQITLRQAVADANAHSGADAINFDPKVFTTSALHTITLTQGQINFTDKSGATTITGPGAKVVAINGNAMSQIFDISSGVTVSILGVTITNGKSATADSSGNTYGGAIVNAGTLSLTNSTLSGNAVVADGFSVKNPVNVVYVPGDARGGAIYSTGSLTISGSTLMGNSVLNTVSGNQETYPSLGGPAYGGAIYSSGSLWLSGTTVSNNTAKGFNSTSYEADELGGFAWGGGIYATASVNIASSTISGNTAQGGNAPVYSIENGGGAGGGGVFSAASVTISNSAISGNTAMGGGSSFDGGDSGSAQGGGVYAAAGLTLTNSTVSSNRVLAGTRDSTGSIGAKSTSAGGGIYAPVSAALTSDTISGNSVIGGPGDVSNPDVPTAGGGGVDGGKLTIAQCTIANNSVTAHLESGVSEYRMGGLCVGGGVDVVDQSTITGTTISGNTAVGGYGYSADMYQSTPGGDGDGGGIFSSATLTITNSTIAANSATGGAGGAASNGGTGFGASQGGNGIGGAIATTESLTLADCTISGNSAHGGAGGAAGTPISNYPVGQAGTATAGGISISPETTILTNTVVSANKAGTIFSDIVGTVSSSSAFNLIGVGGDIVNGVNGNKVGINNPQLLALGNYGGPTQTMLPEPNSPVIDAGSNALIPKGVTTDQRGFARIVGSSVDIGSVELRGGSISGFTYNDLNGDGKKESNEPGLSPWRCFIDSNKNGTLDAGELNAVSDSNGYFIFWDLTPGTYTLSQLAPVGWMHTQPVNLPYTISLQLNQKLTNINFGNRNVGTGTITGTVFNDTNGNGKQDAGEAGLGNRTVYADLYNLGRFIVGDPTTTTKANGTYTLSGVTAGFEIIRQVLPTGWRQIFPTNGTGEHVTVSKNGTVSGAIFADAPIASSPAAITSDDIIDQLLLLGE
jgi:uncharacterized protein (DUF2141 family)